VLVNEPAVPPDLEPATNAWHVYAMSMLDGSLVVILLELHRIDDVVALIDEMYAIPRHGRALPRRCVDKRSKRGPAGCRGKPLGTWSWGKDRICNALEADDHRVTRSASALRQINIEKRRKRPGRAASTTRSSFVATAEDFVALLVLQDHFQAAPVLYVRRRHG
jgi:hypothetical protein